MEPIKPPEPTPTSKLLDDAAPPPPPEGDFAPVKEGPHDWREEAKDPADGFVHYTLSPEGSQPIPGRPNHATSRGPNGTVALRRIGLTLTSSPEDVLKAVAKFAELTREELDGCTVYAGHNKMNAFEVRRPMPGESEPRLSEKDSRLVRIN